MNRQKRLPDYRHKIDTVMHYVLDLRNRTAWCITKVYPNHLREFCIASKAYRRKRERDESVTKKRATIICNSLSTPGALHEGNCRLYS
jgi:hypothetical protein